MSSPIPVNIDTDNPAVITSGLRKYYRRNRALEKLDLTVPEGAVYLLVGPNGSGKTTTMKILLDLVRPDEGSAEVFGFSPIADGPLVRAQIGYVPEGRIPGYEWMRIDHLLATDDLASRCEEAWVDRDERKGSKPSDHAPVLASFSG